MTTHALPVPAQPTLRLPSLARVTVATLVLFAGLTVYMMAVQLQQLVPALAVVAVISLGMAGLAATRRRWAPLVAAFWLMLVFLMNVSGLIFEITHPQNAPYFAFTMLATAVALVGLISGLAATVQRYRSGDGAPPAWFLAAVGAIVGVALGTILIVSVVQRSDVTGISPETLASLPALTSVQGFAFDQQEIRVQAGDVVALRLDNTDTIMHSFDIDELNVHIPMHVGKSELALFRPMKPGTYTYYCAVPGHEAMRGTLIVEP